MKRAQSQTAESLKRRIERLVQLRAEASVPHYYLARLGNQLQDEGFDVRRLTGDSLEILLASMGYQIDSASNAATDKFIYTSSSRTKPQKAFRFSKMLWAAFDTPLLGDQQRFINLRTLAFGSSDEVRSEKDEVREISRRYISEDASDRSADVVRERIRQWLEEQKLPPEAFVDSSPDKKAKRPSRG